MNILLIGNADSVFVKNIVEHVLLKERHNVSILSPGNTKYRSFYQEAGVCVYAQPAFGRIPLLRVFRFQRKIGALFAGHTFDSIHIQFVTTEALLAHVRLKTAGMKSIASFWGSDLFRMPHWRVRFNRRYLRDVDIVTISTAVMKERFRQDYGTGFDGKLREVKFGIGTFDILRELKAEDAGQVREKLGLPKDRKIVAVGYNRSREQQHVRVLEQICRLPGELQRRIHIILRLTYGVFTDGYIDELLELLKKTACTYTCYTEFMDEVQLAMLERCTDVFIHAQTTDAFSATVQEHIYAGALVLNPVWIEYREMKEAGIFYLEYQNFDQLSRLIEEYLAGKEYEEELRGNPEKIYEISSWETAFQKWRNVYRGIIDGA